MKRKILSLALALMMIVSIVAAMPVVNAEEASTSLKFYAKDYIRKDIGVDFQAAGWISGRELSAKEDKSPSFVIPDVTIPETGEYYVTYVAGYQSSASYSKISFTLGETSLGSNDKNFREKMTYGNTAYAMPMSKYIKKMELTEGTFDLAVDITTTYKSQIFQMDYIEIVKADSIESKIITSEDAKIEFEDYGYVGTVTTVAGASGGKIVDTTSWGGFSKDPSLVIPITIEEKGYYEVYSVISEPGESVSNITLKIGDTTVGSNGGASVEKMAYGGTFGTTANSKYLELNKYKKSDLYFEAGDYELVVTIAPGSDGPYKFSLDYVEFVKVNKPTVSATGATKIEAEIAKYFDENFSAAISTKTTASGGQFLFSGGANDDPSFSFPVVIEEAGIYDFRYLVGAAAATGSVSDITIKLDDAVIGKNVKTPSITYQKEADKRADYSSGYASYMPVYSYINRSVELEAKEYTMTVTIGKTAGDSKYKYQIDYFEFIPTQKPAVSKDGATRIEAEIAEVYTEGFGASYTAKDTASACGYLYGDAKKDAPISFEIPVVVEEAGFYDFRYVLGHMKAYTSIITVKIKKGDDEVAAFDNKTAGELNLNENYHTGYDAAMPVYQYTKNGIKLDEGEYTIAVEIAKNGDYCKYQIDYFEFIPFENTVEIEEISIRAEAYVDEAVSGVPVLALYSDGVLAYLTVGEAVSDTNHIEIFGACAEGLTYTDAKIFVWQDDVSSLAPVCKPVIIQ